MNSLITPECISCFIVYQNNSNPEYLLIRRCSSELPGTWQMVSGGVLEGEIASAAVLREIQEETGLIPEELYSADIVETFYMIGPNKITFVPVFAAFVETKEVTLSPTEHDAYEWLTYEEAKERLVWSEQKRAIAHVHENLVLKKPHDLLKIIQEQPHCISIKT